MAFKILWPPVFVILTSDFANIIRKAILFLCIIQLISTTESDEFIFSAENFHSCVLFIKV